MLILQGLDDANQYMPAVPVDPIQIGAHYGLASHETYNAVLYLAAKGLVEHWDESGPGAGVARITAYGQDIVEHPQNHRSEPIAQTIITNNLQGATIAQGIFAGHSNTISGTAKAQTIYHFQSPELEQLLDQLMQAVESASILSDEEKEDAQGHLTIVREELSKSPEQQNSGRILYRLDKVKSVGAGVLAIAELADMITKLVGIR